MGLNKFDTRQSISKTFLSQIANKYNYDNSTPFNFTELDNLLIGIDKELTAPFRLLPNNASNDRVILIEENIVANSETGRRHAATPIKGQMPKLIGGGSITLPATSGSITVTPSTYASPTITIGNSEFVKAIVEIDKAGSLSCTCGVAASSEDLAPMPLVNTSKIQIGLLIISSDVSGNIENIEESDIIQFSAGGGSGGSGGASIEVEATAHGFSVLKPIFHNGTSWALAQANNSDTVATYVVSEVLDADNFIASQFGKIESLAHGLTVGGYYYLSNTVAGEYTSTEPITGYSCPLFYVVDADNVLAMVYRPSAIGGGIASDSEIGSIVRFGTSTTPTGFMPCNGQAVSRNSYSSLFTKIGTTFGVGDGSTTFNLPFDTSLKQYTPTTTSGAGRVVTRSVVVPYLTASGAWRAVINGQVEEGTANFEDTITITGIVFKNGVAQALANGTNSASYARTNQGTSGLYHAHTNTSGQYRWSGDVELESKPTFVDDNGASYNINQYIRFSPKGALQGVYYPEIAIIKEVKPSGTPGGSAIAGWQTRTLNTVENPQSWLSLGSDQITLQAGKYKITGYAPANAVNLSKACLFNVGTSNYDIIGNPMSVSDSLNFTSCVPFCGFINIYEANTFTVRHFTQTARVDEGLGYSNGSTGINEVYTTVTIEKIGE